MDLPLRPVGDGANAIALEDAELHYHPLGLRLPDGIVQEVPTVREYRAMHHVCIDVVQTLPLGLKLKIDEQVLGEILEDEATEKPFAQTWFAAMPLSLSKNHASSAILSRKG